MAEILTPADVVAELNRLMDLQAKGVEALFDAETRLADAERDLDTQEAKAFIAAQGTVADRERLAKLGASDARFARDVARAEVNRVKTKLKGIEQAFMAVSVIAKHIELEWRR